MRQRDDKQALMRDYLLGSLDGERLEQFEVRLLSDAQLRADLESAQDELIDDYAFDALSKKERKSFEQRFLLTPERAEKLRFARAVKEYMAPASADRQELQPTPWWHTLLRHVQGHRLLASLAIAGCLVAVAGAVIIVVREHAARAEAEREVELWTKNPPVSADKYSRFATLSLMPGLMRESNGARRVTIAGDTLAAQLRLELTDRQFVSYEATLLTAEDDKVFTVDSLRPEENDGGRALILRIPVKYLSIGDYQLKLRGTTADGQTADAGSYSFQVVHNNAAR